MIIGKTQSTLDFETIPCGLEIYKLLLTVESSKPSMKHLMSLYMPLSVQICPHRSQSPGVKQDGIIIVTEPVSGLD